MMFSGRKIGELKRRGDGKPYIEGSDFEQGVTHLTQAQRDQTALQLMANSITKVSNKNYPKETIENLSVHDKKFVQHFGGYYRDMKSERLASLILSSQSFSNYRAARGMIRIAFNGCNCGGLKSIHETAQIIASHPQIQRAVNYEAGNGYVSWERDPFQAGGSLHYKEVWATTEKKGKTNPPWIYGQADP